jgi:predicted house-cleaning noncanonical NTP pyrophosphatase (MazG superfamily)
LQKKCIEELHEYLNTSNDKEAIEELADLLEILYALVEIHGSSIHELEKLREKKALERGGFKEKIFLIEVEDK